MITRKEWIKNLGKKDMAFDEDKRRRDTFCTATKSTWGGKWYASLHSVERSGLTVGGLLNPCPQDEVEVFPLEDCFWNKEEAEAECKKRNIKEGWEEAK